MNQEITKRICISGHEVRDIRHNIFKFTCLRCNLLSKGGSFFSYDGPEYIYELSGDREKVDNVIKKLKSLCKDINNYSPFCNSNRANCEELDVGESTIVKGE